MLSLARRAPVTTLSWIALLIVYLGTHGRAIDNGLSVDHLTRAWGVVQNLNLISPKGEVVDSQLYGPFDLWDGEWWRVPVSAMHHVNLLHLLTNLVFAVMCGPWLESRWGGWRYGAFLIGAALVSMPGEFLLGEVAIGYSGVCCAIFGALIALRPHDAELQDRLSDDAVLWTWISLVAMVFLTWANIMQIANVAHFTGLGYGWLAGMMSRIPLWGRAAFIVSHGLLVVPYWFVVHPEWVGRYQWYVAEMRQHEHPEQPWDTDRLTAAVRLDPSLTQVWQRLANDALLRGDLLAAWDDVLNGLQHNPSDPDQWKAGRKLWRRLVSTPLRDAAVQLVQDRFRADSDKWLTELRRVFPPPVLIAPGKPPQPTRQIAEKPRVAPEWEPTNIPWPNHLSPTEPPALDPTDRHSAAEGELL